MKKPVVATVVGGLPEMISHRSTGLLCPPGDPLALAEAVNELLVNPSLREEMCERALQYAKQNLTFAHMMDEMCRFYSGILTQ
jgi:glycosyltransferase involved in cell wall biosynthesis